MSGGGHLTLYRECSPVVDTWYDVRSERTLIEALASALAEAEQVDPVDFPPLYQYLDVEALTQLFGRNVGSNDGPAIFSFRIREWNVFVSDDGRIQICDANRLIDPEPVFEDGKGASD